MFKRVIISGMGIISPIGNTLEEFLCGLKKGHCGVNLLTEIKSDKILKAAKIKNFNPLAFLSLKEKRRMDFASQITLAAAHEAINSSKIDLSKENTSEIGISLGTTAGGTISGEKYFHAKKNNKTLPSLLLDYSLYSAGTQVSIFFNIRGPNYVISTACSSSNIAIGSAYDQIKLGKNKIMLAGGFDTLNLLTLAGFNVLRNMSKSECRPFDKNRQGLILGEGAGILILEELEHCQKRNGPIFGEVLGYGVTSDAYHMTSPDITGKGAALAMEKALAKSNISYNKINYINAHGTGTVYNDLMETRAIKKVFLTNAYKIPISSTKSMVGHTLGASGAIEAITSVLAIKNQFIPPTINYQTPDPQCDLDYVPNQPRNQTIQYALSNNFGFGGINCSVVFGKYTPESKKHE
jgi:3-oxoacyl-[acyl-carrier-protein] synthase II